MLFGVSVHIFSFSFAFAFVVSLSSSFRFRFWFWFAFSCSFSSLGYILHWMRGSRFYSFFPFLTFRFFTTAFSFMLSASNLSCTHTWNQTLQFISFHFISFSVLMHLKYMNRASQFDNFFFFFFSMSHRTCATEEYWIEF